LKAQRRVLQRSESGLISATSLCAVAVMGMHIGGGHPLAGLCGAPRQQGQAGQQ